LANNFHGGANISLGRVDEHFPRWGEQFPQWGCPKHTFTYSHIHTSRYVDAAPALPQRSVSANILHCSVSAHIMLANILQCSIGSAALAQTFDSLHECPIV